MFLRPTILHDATMEAAISNEKYNYMRTQQIEAREVRENMLSPEEHPVLPAEPVAPMPHDEPPGH